jgi:signal transduction histidine kinase
VTLEINDDGIGFDVVDAMQEGKMGLLDMRSHADELGATLEIVSAPGRGTQVKVEVIL